MKKKSALRPAAPRPRPTSPTMRPRRRRRRSVAARLVPLVLLGLSLEIVAVGFFSPRFQVHRVQVEGNRVARAEDLLDRIDVPCGTALLRISPDELAAKLESEPAVARAEVSLRPPDAIAIHITERVPAWNVQTATGWFQADAGGAVFRRLASPAPTLPRLVFNAPLRVGSALPPEKIASARACLRWADKQPGFRLATIQIDRAGKYVLTSREGMEVRLGSPVELEKKLSTMTRLAQEIPELAGGSNVEYVNLFMWDAPAIRYRDPEPLSG